MNYYGKINDCQSLTYVKNSDRTVSIFQNGNPLAPTLQCCSYSGFTFDSDKQKCYWTEPVPCDIENPFKITLNPVGNDGALFFTADNESCTLDIEFDYLFKFTCRNLSSILNTQNPTLNTFVTSESKAIYSQLVQDVEYQTTLCTTLTNQKVLLEAQIAATPSGSSTTILELQLLDITRQLSSCQNSLEKLQFQLDNFQETPIQTLCDRPIDMFETLDASLSLDITDSSNVTTSIFQMYDFFPAIGVGNLYDYLTGNTDTGFYVCKNSACDPIQLIQNGQNNCNSLVNSLIDDLYNQSGLPIPPSGIADTITFNNSLPINSFASNWLTYRLSITDPQIISQLIGNKVKLTINLNHTCGNICILLDNIKLNKICTSVDNTNIFVTKCPGFELERIRDNKKSWISTTTPLNRDFRILDFEGNNAIRQTNYDVTDERLILNTKEIDLDIKMASATETDIWCYAVDNACILTGETYCGPCGYKQFQDDEYFEFMDDEPYQFMDGGIIDNSGGVPPICCGDQIDFNLILTQSLTNTVVLEDFQYIISSELIDAKNRQTISSYATLRALYDRYLNSNTYCGNNSSAFNYMTMEQFSDLVGSYWVDLVEQVIPATTIWGSVRVYSNTIFDQQKFKYRSYSSLFNTNPFDGEKVLSPINGISGQCTTVGVEVSTITNVTNPQSIYTSLCLAQMNHGSEFVGQVTVFKTSE
jgi:hypothetical protein